MTEEELRDIYTEYSIARAEFQHKQAEVIEQLMREGMNVTAAKARAEVGLEDERERYRKADIEWVITKWKMNKELYHNE